MRKIKKYKEEIVIIFMVIIFWIFIALMNSCNKAAPWIGEYYSRDGEIIELFYNGDVYLSFDNDPNILLKYFLLESRICIDRLEMSTNEHLNRTCYLYRYVTCDSILVGGKWFVKNDS